MLKLSNNSAWRRTVLEVFFWTLVVFLAGSTMRHYQPISLSNDGIQYLSAAENFNRGHGVSTSFIHYDTERCQGRIPARLTTFPPGYSIVISAGRIWGNLEAFGRIVSCICYAGTAALIAWALILMGVIAVARQFILTLFVTNAVSIAHSTAVLADPFFTLLTTGALVALICAEVRTLPKHREILLVAVSCLLTGMAYSVRYAGLFLIPVVAGYSLLRWAFERDRLRWLYLLTPMVPIAITGTLMLRNVLAVGTWRGGNDLAVYNPLKRVLADYCWAQMHLILGLHSPMAGVWEGVLLVGTCGVVVFLMAWRPRPGTPDRVPLSALGWAKRPGAAFLLAICVVVYSAGLIYAGVRTVISFGTRMFLPMLPLYLLLLGMGMNRFVSRVPTRARRTWLTVGLLLVAVGYVGVNARDLYYHSTLPPLYEFLAPMYAKPIADGSTLRQWIDSNIGANDVIIATEGQATGYLLHRPTISLISPEYSRARWECDEVKHLMRSYRATYVILYKPSWPNRDFLVGDSQFVRTSLTQQPPCGFVVPAENADIRIVTLGAAGRVQPR